jgi:DNA-binding GntR family transcriptional regulator
LVDAIEARDEPAAIAALREHLHRSEHVASGSVDGFVGA